MIDSLITEAVLYPYQCEEIFSLAHTLFKRLAETSRDFLNLEDLVKQWGGLLMNHSCQEVGNPIWCLCMTLTIPQSVGHPESIDLVAQGLANLLFDATALAKTSNKLMSCR
jgi:ubiquitin carboxyl-terminal hydrolase 34